MNNADNLFDGAEDLGFVVRKTQTQYHIKGVEDLPLSKRELIIFLSRNGVSVEETGLMFTYFDLDRANEAHFGVLGEFLFATTYNP